MADWTSQIIGTGLLSQISEQSDEALRERRSFSLRPNGEKESLQFTIGQISKLLSKSSSAIRRLYDPSLTPKPLPDVKRNSNNIRVWSMPDILLLMERMNQLPAQKYNSTGGVKRLAIQTYKGGAGKSTTTTHLGHYLAKKGYRVLLVDMDPQASTTTYNGLVPDFDIQSNETLHDLFTEDAFNVDGTCQFDTASKIRQLPNWPNIGLLPSNLSMQEAEWQARELVQLHVDSNRPFLLNYLDEALKQVEDDYDVILIDSPPSLGILSLGIIAAADAMVIPLQPTFTDIASTAQFLSLLSTAYEDWLPEKEMHWMRFLLNNVQPVYAHQYAEDWTRDNWGGLVMRSTMVHSAEIASAAMMLQSIYESGGEVGSRSAYKRAIDHADKVCEEIETLITNTWIERT